jgi:hypothetical protein
MVKVHGGRSIDDVDAANHMWFVGLSNFSIGVQYQTFATNPYLTHTRKEIRVSETLGSTQVSCYSNSCNAWWSSIFLHIPPFDQVSKKVVHQEKMCGMGPTHYCNQWMGAKWRNGRGGGIPIPSPQPITWFQVGP